MEGSKAEIKVGLTVLLAIVLLVTGLLWIKGVNIQRNYRNFAVWFPNVGSLEIGDPVSVSGVKRGKVQSIGLSEGGVLVNLQLASDVDIRADAVFAVKNVGLMGERFIGIKTGISNEPWPADSVPRGVFETGVPEVMGLMGRATEDIRDLVRVIRTTIGSEESLARLVSVSENLEQLSAQTVEMVETHRSGIARTLEDLGAAARDLRETVADNKSSIAETVRQFDSAAVKLNRFANGLDTLSSDVRTLVDNINNGDGSLSRLIQDDQLVRRWESTASEIDALVADIRANPQKYLHVKVRIF